jgi:hypothetical protein
MNTQQAAQKEEKEMREIVEGRTKEYSDGLVACLLARFPEIVVSKNEITAGRIRLTAQVPEAYSKQAELDAYAHDHANVAYPEIHIVQRPM